MYNFRGTRYNNRVTRTHNWVGSGYNIMCSGYDIMYSGNNIRENIFQIHSLTRRNENWVTIEPLYLIIMLAFIKISLNKYYSITLSAVTFFINWIFIVTKKNKREFPFFWSLTLKMFSIVVMLSLKHLIQDRIEVSV